MKRLAMSICILLSISAFAQPTEQITVSAQQDSIVYTVNGETSAIANTDMAAYYLSQGIASAIEGDYTGAESKFKVGLLYDLENAEILYNLGLAQYYLEKFEEAIKTFDAAADYDPENKDIYNQRGLCKARSGLLQDAEMDFKIMLKYDPTFAMGNYNYGILKLQMGEQEMACELLNKADQYGYENAPAVIATYCNGFDN
ncbi:MAG: tetratricopeptide repeat protein [Bacteroidetes bacterium]|nr:tetratricopeptide repeat protein [Bacteroidota bacterium]